MAPIGWIWTVSSSFVKTGDPSAIAWEYCGLEWLREAEPAGGVRIAPVLSHDSGRLVTRRLSPSSLTPRSAEDFGRSLYLLHRCGAPAFGAVPPGWDQDVPGWIGHTRLGIGCYPSWGVFYARTRLLPHLHRAVDLGAISMAEAHNIEELALRVEAGIFDDGRPPARIHGDLWSGNAISTAPGVTLIDPAAHGGHGETDLAMLALFGYPLLDRIQDAYAEAAGLDDNWRTRIPLHQLHPLLVHAELFGGGYGSQASQLAMHLLSYTQ